MMRSRQVYGTCHTHSPYLNMPLLFNDGLDLRHAQGRNRTQHAVFQIRLLTGTIPKQQQPALK